MKRTWWIAILVLALAGWGVWQWSEGGRGASAGGPPPAAAGGTKEPKALRVDVHRVEAQPLTEAVTATGEVRASERVELTASAAGRVQSIFFAEGTRVRRGEVLVKIEDSELRAQLQRAEVERQLAETRERRAKRLLDEETISQETYDEASADLDSLAAEIELIQARLDKTQVRAPFSGVVGLRRISEGAYVTPSDPLATLQSLDPVKIDFSVPEKYAGRVRDGQEIIFTVAGSDQEHQGTIYALEPAVDSETRSLQLRARSPNPDRSLVPGAFAQVRLVLDTRPEALLVPSLSLVPELGRTTVFVVEDGVARQREVSIGARLESQVEIVRGLEPGDLVLTSGLQQVQPGAAVEAR
ncbi:MAG: efflux RND transporter periplasmic adaptor subunit [Acidobacteriota bacterium]|nr:efflux RND transporter periplasmic adaptor subunit [Acidobacteriota bacterium]